jgi:hypothetical protein
MTGAVVPTAPVDSFFLGLVTGSNVDPLQASLIARTARAADTGAGKIVGSCEGGENRDLESTDTSARVLAFFAQSRARLH